MSESLSYANLNALWSTFFVETLARSGLKHAVISPGSRSGPLAWALARNDAIEAIPVLDERSAAFFALGLARSSGVPALVLGTSGTAGAHFYPAVVEAREDGVPLLVVTADRPPEMRQCGAGQTTDQQQLYGAFPRWQTELLLPEPVPARFRYLRQTLGRAWEMVRGPFPGPVHLNLPFREPLAPVEDDTVKHLAEGDLISDLLTTVAPQPAAPRCRVEVSEKRMLLEKWKSVERGVIVAGPAFPADASAYARAAETLAGALGWPVLADGLSPLRHFIEETAGRISRYEFILASPGQAASLSPEVAVRLGPLPTGKRLRSWLEEVAPETYVLDPGDRNLDPLHGNTRFLRTGVEDFVADLAVRASPGSDYRKHWAALEETVEEELSGRLEGETALFEGKIAWVLSRNLPENTPCFIANSMPARDVEFFWETNARRFRPYCNRGVNGIDGTLSTALGVCHRNRPGVLLTGDLALLHDTNGFLSLPRFEGGLTIIMVNNRGGGIFERLPISRFDPPFEAFFATPQTVDFERLASAYGAEHRQIESWTELTASIEKLPERGVRLLEIPTGREEDSAYRKALFKQIAERLDRELVRYP